MLCRGWKQVEGTGTRARTREYSTEEAWGVREVMGSVARPSSHSCYRVKQWRRARAGVNSNPQEMKSAEFGGSTVSLETKTHQAQAARCQQQEKDRGMETVSDPASSALHFFSSQSEAIESQSHP